MQEFKRLKMILKVARSIASTCLALVVLFSMSLVIAGVGWVVEIYKELLQGLIPRHLPEFPFLVELRGKISLVIVIVGVSVGAIFDKFFTKKFEDIVLKAITYEAQWTQEDVRFEQDKVRREIELREENEAEGKTSLDCFISQIFSFREYGTFKESELKFLDEKFGLIVEQQPHQQTSYVQGGYEKVVDDAVSDAQAREKAEERIRQYEEELSEKYPPDIVRQKVEELRMRIFQELNQDL